MQLAELAIERDYCCQKWNKTNRKKKNLGRREDVQLTQVNFAVFMGLGDCGIMNTKPEDVMG